MTYIRKGRYKREWIFKMPLIGWCRVRFLPFLPDEER